MKAASRQNVPRKPVDMHSWFGFLKHLVQTTGEPDHNEDLEELGSNSVWLRRDGREFCVVIAYRDPHYAFGARGPRGFRMFYSRRALALRLEVTERGRRLEWEAGNLEDLPRHHGRAGRRFFDFLVQLGKPRRGRWRLGEREARACARHLVNSFSA